jgi:putative membrane protein
MYVLVRWLLNAIALWVTAELGVGIFFTEPGLGPVLLAALVLGLVNAVVRPIMIVLTLPLTILTLGLFLLVVNALTLLIVAALTPLETTGFGGAILAAIVLSLVSTVLSALVGTRRPREW